jgi:hypothetical protein
MARAPAHGLPPADPMLPPEEAYPPEQYPEPPPEPPILEPGVAYGLFFNGSRIVRAGDSPKAWITMGRTHDGTPVMSTPVTEEMIEEIKNGSFYKLDP